MNNAKNQAQKIFVEADSLSHAKEWARRTCISIFPKDDRPGGDMVYRFQDGSRLVAGNCGFHACDDDEDLP